MFSTILAPVQLVERDLAQRTVDVAGRLAHDWGAELVLATIMPHWVTEKDADYSWDARRWFEARATAGLERLKAACPHDRCRTLARWGSVPGSILDVAEDIGADVIVMAAEEPTLTDIFHRPAALRIAAKSLSSVLLVR